MPVPGVGSWNSVDNIRFVSSLPIELINFSVSLIQTNKSLIEWTTETEINNDYFTVERSIDAVNWENIYKIDGAGNSSSILSYSKIDHDPYYSISYYRLKQTDFDGQFEYSQIIMVNIQQLSNSKIEIYPNPSTNQIIIKGSSNELKETLIYNRLGQNVTSLVNQVITNENQLVIDLSKLKSGMYYIKTKTTVNKVCKK